VLRGPPSLMPGDITVSLVACAPSLTVERGTLSTFDSDVHQLESQRLRINLAAVRTTDACESYSSGERQRETTREKEGEREKGDGREGTFTGVGKSHDG